MALNLNFLKDNCHWIALGLGLCVLCLLFFPKSEHMMNASHPSSPSGPLIPPTSVVTMAPNIGALPDVQIVNFYTHWCPASTKFLPIWNEFANEVQTKYPFVKAVDKVCENGGLYECNAQGIDGYPTVMLFIGNKRIPFDRPLNIVSLMQFVTEHLHNYGYISNYG
jgi:hypothetical protein